MVLPEAFKRACADPPQIHPGAPHGVWSTERSCYRFISEHTDESSRTLETGIGLSTVLFAILGSEHTALFLYPGEGDELRTWARTHDVDLEQVELLVDRSDLVLPSLPDDPLDLFFIDGGHGYPLPQLDWFYGGSRLRRGGILVVDDLELWAPHQLATFLNADPRWEPLGGTRKWRGYRRLSEGSLLEDWTEQRFLPIPHTQGALKRLRKALPVHRHRRSKRR
jgi:methyltransferase family protein